MHEIIIACGEKGESMQFVANGALVIGKRAGTYKKSGEPFYQIQLSNGLGGQFTGDCSVDLYNIAEPLGPRYSVTVNIDTNGYNQFINITELVEE